MTDVITTADELACAERELKYREWVYPRWVASGKMSAGKAAHEIEAMKSIVARLRSAAEKDRLL